MTSLCNSFVRSLTGVLALLLIVSVAHADAPYSFDATPGQLPKAVAPIHYTLDLQPDLEALTVAGSMVIDIEVRAPTDRFVLNAVSEHDRDRPLQAADRLFGADQQHRPRHLLHRLWH